MLDNKLYYNKYLKYKKKYIELKGGNNTFYIYTTGLAQTGLLDLFNKELLEPIISCIPENKSIINIIHYDEFKSNNLQLKTLISGKTITNKFISKHLKIPEISKFEKPHIVIDMAHIFGYYPSGYYPPITDTNKYDRKYDAYWSGIYDTPQRGITTKLEIKSIYIGENNKYKIGNEKLFIVNSDDSIRTFIDCLIDTNFIFDKGEINPDKILYDIADNLVKFQILFDKEIFINKLNTENKNKYIKMSSKEITKLYKEIIIKYNILNEILAKLFQNKTMKEIINIKTYNLYDKIKKETKDDINTFYSNIMINQ